ncbi:MAG: SpoIIE family protein phosphatase [Selenomonas sp.]|uniref:SpoIIE family protein phosphatase n=1 Tax=Selenomonas sp. TaxID=2053611 RepID=UPI0026012AE2|nr:SpoIIE family protein phosphatase [Selenomonas sp.]MCR5757436.1 SpoIIE family protein phosphatase [Selenomonas sp.]
MRLSIRRKVLFILLSGVITTSLAVAGLSIYSLTKTRKAMEGESANLGLFLTDSMGGYTERFARARLKEVTATKAQHLDRELYNIQDDLRYMANAMYIILTHPEDYRPRSLPDTRKEADILSGKPYIHYSAAMLQQGVSPEMEKEIALASNFADVLRSMSLAYMGGRSSLYAGSKNGYLLCLDLVTSDNTQTSIFPSPEHKRDFLNNYDHRNRTWYIQGKDADKPIFSNAYIGAEGNLDMTCALPYYDANGFAGVMGISYTVEDIYESLVETAMEYNGDSFVVDGSGNIILSSEKEGLLSVASEKKDLRQSDNPGIAEAAQCMTKGDTCVTSVELDGKSYYLAYAPLQNIGWSLCLLLDSSEIMDPVEKVESDVMTKVQAFQKTLQETLSTVLLWGLLLLIPILILLIYISDWLAGRFTRPVRRLAEGAREIARGNFDKKITLTTGDELEHLAEAFNFMTDELKKYMKNLANVAAKEERTRTELSVAGKIQADMLPQNFTDFPDHPEFDIYALMEPAKNVGGDFYDFYLLRRRYLVVTVADVSGKGVPAALFMAKSQSVLKNAVLRADNPEDMGRILSKANNELCQNNEATMFVTVFIGVLDLETGHFTYANGGHCPPLLGHEGHYEFMPLKKNCVLGLTERDYTQQSIDLSPQDTLFIYTDGVSEAMNEQDELFTEARIKEGLNHLSDRQDVSAILDQMLQVVRQYAGDAEQSDDITMLGLRYRGK